MCIEGRGLKRRIWKHGNAVLLGARQTQRYVIDVGFFGMVWSMRFISFSFARHKAVCFPPADHNKTLKVVQVYAPIRASDVDEAGEFPDEHESILIVKFTYTDNFSD